MNIPWRRRPAPEPEPTEPRDDWSEEAKTLADNYDVIRIPGHDPIVLPALSENTYALMTEAQLNDVDLANERERHAFMVGLRVGTRGVSQEAKEVAAQMKGRKPIGDPGHDETPPP